MKSIFTSLFCLVSIYACAQNTQRRVGFRVIGKDSINLALNEDYQMIEDSCATIIRHAHYDIHNRVYTGKFTDVSKANPSLVLSEGNYTAEGLKDGEFISRFTNGNLQSRGRYKKDKYDGKWELNYDNGKPKIEFEATDAEIKIINVWNEKGAKVVDNGRGNYTGNVGSITWHGKLFDGKPDGIWKAYRTDDATQTTFAIELFKKGVFKKGSNSVGNYTDASRIEIFDQKMFPYIIAENMVVSATSCGETKTTYFVSAQCYLVATFSEEISRLINSILSVVDIARFNNSQLVMEGIVSETGIIYNLKNISSFYDPTAQDIIDKLRKLPSVKPATIDGKPVKSKITISIDFNAGVYRYSWRFSQNPIK